MRPGTYFPTDPREHYVFAMERLKNKSTDLSKQLSSYETSYREFGVRYHSLPIVFRETMVDGELVRAAFKAFFVRKEDESSYSVPEIFKHFTQLRSYRDNAKQALYHGDIRTAEQQLEAMENLLTETHTLLGSVANSIGRLYLQFEKSHLNAVDPEDYAVDAEEYRKNFCLNLPEVVNAFETSMIETEQQALSMVLESANEEREVVATGLGPGEVEQGSLFPEQSSLFPQQGPFLPW